MGFARASTVGVVLSLGWLLSVPWAWGQTSDQAPLVVRKLFVPAGDGVPRTPEGAASIAEGRFVLTGVMVLPDGKRALLEIKDSAQAKEGLSKMWWREGEAVGGYVLETIEPSAVVLTGSQQKVRIPLYGTPKQRPQPTTTASVTEQEAPKASGHNLGKNPIAGQQGHAKGGEASAPAVARAAPAVSETAPEQTSKSELQGVSKKPAIAPQGGQGAPSFGNPFLEALRRAQEGQGGGSELQTPANPTAPSR